MAVGGMRAPLWCSTATQILIEIVSALGSRRSALGRAQVDPQVGESFVVLRIALLIEDGEEVFLAWLTKGEPIQGALPLETRFALLVSAQRERRDAALDFRVARIRPPRPEIIHVGAAAELYSGERGVPRIRFPRAQRLGAVRRANVLAYGVTFEPMDSPRTVSRSG